MRRTRRRLWTALLTIGLLVALGAPGTSSPAVADGNEAPAAPAAARGLTAGLTHTCTIVSGALYCWGGNASGQLGLSDTNNRADGGGETGYFLPAVSLPPGRMATAVTAGDAHTCVILDDGTLRCWGANGSGQLGLGNTTSRGNTTGTMGANLPAVDLGAGRTATAITAGANHTCALLDNATVKCWGANAFGQLGLGDTNPRGDGANEMGANLPAVDLGAGRTATAITAGGNHTCALLDNATVKCWGGNASGQLGLGDTNPRGDAIGEMGANLPPVDLGAGRTATAITALRAAVCTRLDNATVKCWGSNGSGQLGLGDTNHRGDGTNEMGANLPTVDLGAGRTASAVAGGGSHVCALLDDASVRCWGSNDSGELGLGDTSARGDGANEMGANLPTVDLGAGRTATAVTAGDDHTCAVLDTGARKCWGWNSEGELGQGDTRRRGITPADMGDSLVPILLPPIGLLQGQVSDATTNVAITDVDVIVLRTADFSLVRAATSSAGGLFSMQLPPGTYFLYLLDASAQHREGFFGPPTTVTVTNGLTTNVTPTMPTARGAFSGTVTDQRTGQPITGALVFAIGPSGIAARGVTAANGQYTVSGLVSSTYHAVFIDPTGTGRTAEYYPNSPDYGGSSAFSVLASATTPGIDGSLSHP
jgi:alpha-tubulin suppressor-like RCC1 family protein